MHYCIVLSAAQDIKILNVRLKDEGEGSNFGVLQFLSPTPTGTDWLYSCGVTDISTLSVICRMLGYESDSERVTFSSKWNQ